jgi:hypothetical protein
MLFFFVYLAELFQHYVLNKKIADVGALEQKCGRLCEMQLERKSVLRVYQQQSGDDGTDHYQEE